MDTKTITDAVLLSESKPATIRTPMQLWQDGYNAGIRGALLEEMQTEDEIFGWWAARTPKGAGVEADEWLTARLEEQQDGREDDEWTRWGC